MATHAKYSVLESLQASRAENASVAAVFSGLFCSIGIGNSRAGWGNMPYVVRTLSALAHPIQPCSRWHQRGCCAPHVVPH